jgi:pimeloyl-ACP methyl ester carboxylesterase
MSPDSLMEIVNGRSMKQETLDAAPRIENPRSSGRGVRQWFTRTIGSSITCTGNANARRFKRRLSARVPFALAAFPKELTTPPRRLLERSFRVERYTAMPAGGHFAALEQPERLAADITAFFRPLR